MATIESVLQKYTDISEPPILNNYYKYTFYFIGNAKDSNGKTVILNGTYGGDADSIYRFNPFYDMSWGNMDTLSIKDDQDKEIEYVVDRDSFF